MITLFAFILAIFILVAVHEFGHFYIARLNNIRVLNFSIGFGPALLKRKDKLGTEYKLAPIPLGGYVRMLDEREAPVSNDLLPYAFNRKSPWAKLSVVIAGPLFNFLLAFIAFYVMYLYGVNIERPVIQHVIPGSPADMAGMAVDQEIISVNNTPIKSIEDLQIVLAARLGTSQEIIIKTQDFIKDITITNTNNNTSKKTYKYNLKNQNQVWQADINNEPVSNSIGISMLPENPNVLLVDSISSDTNAVLTALKTGDLIIGYAALTDKTTETKFNQIDTWNSFVNYIRDNPNKDIQLKILRKAKINNKSKYIEKIINITIGDNIVKQDENSRTAPTLEKVGYLGVVFSYPLYFDNQGYGIIQGIAKAFDRTLFYIKQTFYMLYKLFIGELGLETIRGPVMVAKAAGIQMQIGIANFLNFLGIISIGLGVINLLPIPVLDGGHVVYHLYELITGKQASLLAEKIGLIIGITLLVMTMTLAFYNDFIYW